jgi:hypothetical protein
VVYLQLFKAIDARFPWIYEGFATKIPDSTFAQNGDLPFQVLTGFGTIPRNPLFRGEYLHFPPYRWPRARGEPLTGSGVESIVTLR